MFTDEPICVRCGEGFPVAQEPTRWRMGELRPLSKAPQFVINRVRASGVNVSKAHLCGNCYFDLTDDEDE